MGGRLGGREWGKQLEGTFNPVPEQAKCRVNRGQVVSDHTWVTELVRSKNIMCQGPEATESLERQVVVLHLETGHKNVAGKEHGSRQRPDLEVLCRPH